MLCYPALFCPMTTCGDKQSAASDTVMTPREQSDSLTHMLHEEKKMGKTDLFGFKKVVHGKFGVFTTLKQQKW